MNDGSVNSKSRKQRQVPWYLKASMALVLCVHWLLISPASETPYGPEAKHDTIRFGIIAFYNPRVMILKYQPLMDALTERTDFRFELVLSTTYRQAVEQFKTGAVDIAYLGPVTYLRAHHDFGAEPLVKLNTSGKGTFQSVIAVRDISSLQTLGELKGKRFAFGSPLSTSSHLYPRQMLRDAGLTLHDLGSYEYYRHHDSAAHAVLTGRAEACGVRDVLAERYMPRGLRVIAVSEPIPNFPLAVHPEMPEERAKALRRAFLSLDPENPADKRMMAAWDRELREGFAPVRHEEYAAVEHLMNSLFGADAFKGSLLPEDREGGS
ncbi:phosphate/phosphite/phosphonate ABC transporter substrate-binding protein [bacterium]|nr:phosphate/phosphite/phosphonate ABC transporter substrate-binding protein [bacterium]